ncbi:hypothetical protein [Streptomyces axinellae]|uniref:GIY-YIG nuclease family protein n=1 Tax=Streptomyces axinellae TaxID=552788 RepID=A0ABP6C898_9ACTN
MGSFSRPSLGSDTHRALNNALHDLHLRAGYPSSRDISRAIRLGDYRTTASHERVRSAFSHVQLPAWSLVEALAEVLAPLAGSSVVAEVGILRKLWQQAHMPTGAVPVTLTEPPLKPSGGEPGHAESTGTAAEPLTFGVDLVRAVAEQLNQKLTTLPAFPLTGQPFDGVPRSPGVYRLFLQNRAVYFGKSEKDLRRSLESVRRKVSGRQNLPSEAVSYQMIPMDASTVWLPLERLITSDDMYPWNYNGFSARDPGRNRDRTRLKEQHFDLCYPIDLDWCFPQAIEGTTLSDLVRDIRQSLPYGFRHAPLPDPSPPPGKDVTQGQPARAVFRELAWGPLSGWQITALPGYTIAYPEESAYPQAVGMFRRAALEEPESPAEAGAP